MSIFHIKTIHGTGAEIAATSLQEALELVGWSEDQVASASKYQVKGFIVRRDDGVETLNSQARCGAW